MTRKVPVVHTDRQAAVKAQSDLDPRVEQIMARPDGFYWSAPDGKQEFGPFESVELALADMTAAEERAPVPGETLQEAENEIGIADWIDPETGEPAEGQSPPRLDEE
jgi:hypothetical protein